MSTPFGGEVRFAAVSATTLGDNTLVAAVAGKRIIVLGGSLVATGGANTMRFESGAGGTALTGLMDIIADGQLTFPPYDHGYFGTTSGALLNLELSAATAVGGWIIYVLVD